MFVHASKPIRVATGAKWRVSGKLISYCRAIAGMTTDTSDFGIMRSRIIAGATSSVLRVRAVIKIVCRYPADSSVAGVTLNGGPGFKVTRCWLRGSTTIYNMAVQTSARAIRAMIPSGTDKGGSGVARDAIQCCWNMWRIGFRIHTFSTVTMAARSGAIVNNTGMIENGANKRCCRMANTTILCR